MTNGETGTARGNEHFSLPRRGTLIISPGEVSVQPKVQLAGEGAGVPPRKLTGKSVEDHGDHESKKKREVTNADLFPHTEPMTRQEQRDLANKTRLFIEKAGERGLVKRQNRIVRTVSKYVNSLRSR